VTVLLELVSKMKENMENIYIPQFKWQLVDALKRFYPNDNSFVHKTKKQLYAIYFNTRKRLGR
jgi:hypothetical protein